MGLSAGAICAMSDEEFHEWSKSYEKNTPKEQWKLVKEEIHNSVELNAVVKVLVERDVRMGTLRTSLEVISKK
jgi:hypothetical protein